MQLNPNRFIARHVASIPRSGIRDFFDIVLGMKDVISLGVGEPGFVTPLHIRQAAIQGLEQGRTTYTSNLGLLSLAKPSPKTSLSTTTSHTIRKRKSS